MFSLVWLMLLVFLPNAQTLADYNNMLHGKAIFILAGQSNMAGRGGISNGTWDGYVPHQCRPDPRILRLTKTLQWEEAEEPLHRDIDVKKTCGIGPGMIFAHSLLHATGFPSIGLVPCAIGGTNISQWMRGGWLYNQLLTRAEAALQDAGSGGLIKAILWYQGESDTMNRDNARLYKKRLERFITDIRSDLMSPVLPVIQVALASGEGPFVDVIREAQLAIHIPNVRTVDAKGFELESDGLHLTTAAQVRLGRSLAQAFLQIMAPLPVRSSATRMSHIPHFNFINGWFR